MSQINLKKLSADHKNSLGRLYQFIIERGRRNRAKMEQAQAATNSSSMKVNLLARTNLS